MKKMLFIVLMTGLSLLSCDSGNDIIPACNVDDPLVELDWLKSIKNSMTSCTCEVSILQGTYKEKTVFYLMVTDPACNSIFHVVLWDCNGDVVKEYKPGEIAVFSSEVELVSNLYTCTK